MEVVISQEYGLKKRQEAFIIDVDSEDPRHAMTPHHRSCAQGQESCAMWTYRIAQVSTGRMKGRRADRRRELRVQKNKTKLGWFYSGQPLPTHPIMPRNTAKIVIESQSP
jgi:hypothetical protein